MITPDYKMKKIIHTCNIQESREEKIFKVFKKIHGNIVPMFFWDNHDPMRYVYSPSTDAILCDCDVSVSLGDISTDNVTFQTILDKIFRLEEKVWEKFKSEYGIELTYND